MENKSFQSADCKIKVENSNAKQIQMQIVIIISNSKFINLKEKNTERIDPKILILLQEYYQKVKLFI